MKRVEAIIRPEKLTEVLLALEGKGFLGSTISDVRGHGRQASGQGTYRGRKFELHVSHKILVEIVCEDAEVSVVVQTVTASARTGAVGDGIVMVSDLAAVYQIRSGAKDSEAIASTRAAAPQ